MTNATVEAPVRFHLSLNVSNIPQAVSFLEQILGVPVAKLRPDYAKFELDSPPLVLSLEQHAPGAHGSLNHLGFRFPDSASLVAAQERIARAGVATQREEGVECCYAKQTKFWVNDKDQRLWEFYTLDDDGLDHRGAGQTVDQMAANSSASCAPNCAPVQLQTAPAPAVWEHRMHTPFQAPATPCDAVRLRGTFNVPHAREQRRTQLGQAFAALQPGGEIMVHVLTSEEPVVGELNLPGPAAYVQHVPVRQELLQDLEQAGFVDLQLTTFRSGACFTHAEIPLRETQIVGRRPLQDRGETCEVVFKGPFQRVQDDAGHEWQRGVPVSIPLARWEMIQQSATADLFVRLPALAPVSHCGT